MNIQTRRTNFSQFSKDLWIRVSEGNVTIDVEIEYKELLDFAVMLIGVADDALSKIIDVEIDHKELLDFAVMLIGVADDALSKIGEDAHSCQLKLSDCLEELHNITWPASIN